MIPIWNNPPNGITGSPNGMKIDAMTNDKSGNIWSVSTIPVSPTPYPVKVSNNSTNFVNTTTITTTTVFIITTTSDTYTDTFLILGFQVYHCYYLHFYCCGY